MSVQTAHIIGYAGLACLAILVAFASYALLFGPNNIINGGPVPPTAPCLDCMSE